MSLNSERLIGVHSITSSQSLGEEPDLDIWTEVCYLKFSKSEPFSNGPDSDEPQTIEEKPLLKNICSILSVCYHFFVGSNFAK